MGFDWVGENRRLLKKELVRMGVDTKELVVRLGLIGVEETEVSVRHKLRRGTFSCTFFVQCLTAIDAVQPSMAVSFSSQIGSVNELYARYMAAQKMGPPAAVLPKRSARSRSLTC